MNLMLQLELLVDEAQAPRDHFQRGLDSLVYFSRPGMRGLEVRQRQLAVEGQADLLHRWEHEGLRVRTKGFGFYFSALP